MRAPIRKLVVAGSAAALTLLLAAVALAGVQTGSYKGTTTQTGDPNGTVKFNVARDHTNVKSFQAFIYSNCTKSGHPAQMIGITLNLNRTNMVIHGVKFSFKGKFNLDNGLVVVAHNVDGAIGGKFATSKNVTGTMKFDWTFDNNALRQFRGDRCTTGTAQFTANHA
jgi:hypothetical protein